MIKYLIKMLDDFIESIINWFIDSSHQIHEDCKGHTGAALTIGKGAVLSKASGQKGNLSLIHI